MPSQRARVRVRSLPLKLLFAAGWGVFWLTVAAGDRLPEQILFCGPVVMLAATLLLAKKGANRRPPPGKHDSTSR